MRQRIYTVEYAGHPIRYSFLNAGTQYHFRNYIQWFDGDDFDIRITPELMEIGRKALPDESIDSYVEYRILISETARELLRYGCCLFHSVAFVFRGKAFLLAAPSGTGKTTQYLNWQILHPGEIEMICGDMPVLALEEDGLIRVHSTSWCGKEHFGNRELSAPLAGIVLLEQGSENCISPLPPGECIMSFFCQIMARPETDIQCIMLSGIIDRILRSIPVWKLINIGDNESTEMLRSTLNNWMDDVIGGAHDQL